MRSLAHQRDAAFAELRAPQVLRAERAVEERRAVVRFADAFRVALFFWVLVAADFDRRVLTRLVCGMSHTPKK